MKNKEITIYELMGLIKDGKAPYEITYKGTKYYLDDLENYYRAKDTTSLFESIFNDYNDYDALQEKVTIPEENDEWEDIEEIQVGDVYDITKVLNKLIKNQQKIIERLEGKDE